MRRLLLLLAFLTAGMVRAETPALLQGALQKLLANEDHWAFTRTTQSFDKKGKPTGGPYVERYDPSKPFDRQWELFKYNGRSPTNLELSSWRRAKSKRASERHEHSLIDKLDLDHVTVAAETSDLVTYLVPVLKNASRRFPADKVEVFMTVDRGQDVLTAFSVQPREPFRVAGVFKLESGRIDGRLDVVNRQYAPALTWVKGDGHLKLLGLFHVGLGAEQSFSDFQRVKPYNDRFTVKIGDIKALDF